ncbi:hypothetical protein K402DRAFT_391452 [Aulographum hederae CBS 113979]|uniref:Uncharacterized protein n=1 Tax=Aulographum hederae CBS 113979 TaxID=1176131 RepID=A0A6G1H6U0_9PEZI|nr:hypothetical protein K402DRAFT_391452 [Aulographum hederae CBS 113979]
MARRIYPLLVLSLFLTTLIFFFRGYSGLPSVPSSIRPYFPSSSPAATDDGAAEEKLPSNNEFASDEEIEVAPSSASSSKTASGSSQQTGHPISDPFEYDPASPILTKVTQSYFSEVIPSILSTPSAETSLLAESTPSQATPSSDPIPLPKKPSTTPLKISITETGGYHDEVVAALLHSFGSQPDAVVQRYLRVQRFGIQDIIRTFNLSTPLPASKKPAELRTDVKTEDGKPDVLVFSTCELDGRNYAGMLSGLLGDGEETPYLFCVVHHAEKWVDEGLETIFTPWVNKGRMSFLTLSPHVSEFLKGKSLSQWEGVKKEPVVRAYTPVFPVTLPTNRNGNGTASTAHADGGQDESELSFALQGNYDPGRRDYDTLFAHLGDFLQQQKLQLEKQKPKSAPSALEDIDTTNVEPTFKNQTLILHLLGNGKKPPVPAHLTNHVHFDENLSYLDFYALLSRSVALLPAFASRDYLDRKASSSVPASLIAGVPLVGTREMVRAYGYLEEGGVWVQKDGDGEGNGEGKEETDMDVVGRVLGLEEGEREEKRRAVRGVCDGIVKGNVGLVGEWVQEALALRPGGVDGEVEVDDDIEENPSQATKKPSPENEGVGAPLEGEVKAPSSSSPVTEAGARSDGQSEEKKPKEQTEESPSKESQGDEEEEEEWIEFGGSDTSSEPAKST